MQLLYSLSFHFFESALIHFHMHGANEEHLSEHRESNRFLCSLILTDFGRNLSLCRTAAWCASASSCSCSCCCSSLARSFTESSTFCSCLVAFCCCLASKACSTCSTCCSGWLSSDLVLPASWASSELCPTSAASSWGANLLANLLRSLLASSASARACCCLAGVN